MRTPRTIGVIVAAALAATLPVAIAPAASAAGAPYSATISQGDLGVAAELGGDTGIWPETRNTGEGHFVAGPATAPLGTGSYSLKSNVVGDKQFLHFGKAGTETLAGLPLSQLSLQYDSRTTAANYGPYVNIEFTSAHVLGSPTMYASLSYEPAYNGGIAANTWKHWDATASTGVWWSTRDIDNGGVTIPRFTTKTWSEWMTILDDATVYPTWGSLSLIIGDTSSSFWAGITGNVDNVVIGTPTTTATYDLEEGLGDCPVTVDAVTKTLTMVGDCTTSANLTIKDGWTLDGAGHTLTAVDPSPSVDYTGSVLANRTTGGSMNIENLTVVGSFGPGCSSSLNGIRWDNAGGDLSNVTVSGIRYGTGSGCQSGNSIDVNNTTSTTRRVVTMDDVHVTQWQKTGIRINGVVKVNLTDSSVDSANLDMITASNSIQISRGARAYVADNTIAGNDWDGDSMWSATAVLMYGPGDVYFTRNHVVGDDTDYGVYVYGDATYPVGNVRVTCNLIERDAASDALDLWNVGLGAADDMVFTATGNTVRGFATSFENVILEDGGDCTNPAVDNLSANGGSGSVHATWDAPTTPATAPVDHYLVTLSPGGAHKTVTGTSATFTGLDDAKEYTVTVVPVNAAGQGDPASASATTGPGAVTVTDVAATSSGATVHWTAPGNGYTLFTVALTQGGDPVSTRFLDGDARGVSFSNLDASTTYVVEVTGFVGANSGASGSWGFSTDEEFTWTPPAEAPDSVSGLALSGKPTQLKATWFAVDGADYYEAELTPGGVTQTVTSPSATFPIVAGQIYTVTVRAHGEGGFGKESARSIDTHKPGRSTSFLVFGGVGVADLTWSVPSSPTALTRYVVKATTPGKPAVVRAYKAAGLTFPVRMSGLTRDRTYTFVLTAENAFGAGPTATKKAPATEMKMVTSAKNVSKGGLLYLDGKATDRATKKAVPSLKVILFTRIPGSADWQRVGRVATTMSDGSFRVKLHPKRTMEYRVETGTYNRMGTSSNIVKVTVS